jgi:hypothetical protein
LHKETLPGREDGIVGNGLIETGVPNTVRVAAQTYYSTLYNFAEPSYIAQTSSNFAVNY